MRIPPNVEDRLGTEPIIWMTTVAGSGMPQTSPVWFWWHNGQFLIYSKDDTARTRNIAINERVGLNLDGDGRGGAIVVIEGLARIDRGHAPASAMPEYIEKYQPFLNQYGWSAEGFSADYPIPIIVRPERVRSW